MRYPESKQEVVARTEAVNEDAEEMSELLSDYVHTNEAVTVLITEGAIVELEQTHNSMDSNFTESADWDFETDKDLEKIEPYINGYRTESELKNPPLGVPSNHQKKRGKYRPFSMVPNGAKSDTSGFSITILASCVLKVG